MKLFARDVAHKGFTLVEMLVAISIFMLVMVSTLGAFLSMVDLNKKVQNVRVAMDNANLAMESMMRTIRLGYDYEPGVDTSSISLKDQDGYPVVYSIVCNEDPRRCSNFALTVNKRDTGAVTITSSDLKLEQVEFIVTGESLTDNIQPSVKIFIKGKTNLPQIKDRLNFDFVFQSIATQRLYDK